MPRKGWSVAIEWVQVDAPCQLRHVNVLVQRKARDCGPLDAPTVAIANTLLQDFGYQLIALTASAGTQTLVLDRVEPPSLVRVEA